MESTASEEMSVAIEQTFLGLEVEMRDIIQMSIDKAFALGREHERNLVADRLPHLIGSFLRHPAYRLSSAAEVFDAVARKVRRGLGYEEEEV